MAIPARRRVADVVAFTFATAATVFGLVWLAWILWTTLAQGAAALTPALFKEMTPPPGASGGLLNAFYGSAVMILLGLVIGAPIGVAAGTYLAEHGRYTRLAAIVSFVNDILLSAPSIVIGLFVYELVVRTSGHFSGYAGALALAMILLPIVVRTTEESLRLVPDQMREAGFALGLPRWRVTPLPGGVERDPHRHTARCRSNRRRDRAPPVHSAQQPVLELEPQRTARQRARCHLSVRNEPL